MTRKQSRNNITISVKKPTKPKTNKSHAKIKQTNKFPEEFPFWARLKIEKKRPTLVIDEDKVLDKHSRKMVDGYVHRELTSSFKKGREELFPNPDRSKKTSAYLKPAKKAPKKLFKANNKNLDMPQSLKERYSKNNNKK